MAQAMGSKPSLRRSPGTGRKQVGQASWPVKAGSQTRPLTCVPLLLLRRCNIGQRQIPMPQQNLEPPLFFALVSLLVGPKLPDQPLLVRIRGCRQGRVLEPYRNAIIPSRILGHVVAGLLNLHRDHAPALDNLLKQRVVVLQKELQEFLLMPPLHLVVILECVGLVGSPLWRRPLGEHALRKTAKQQGQNQFSISIPPTQESLCILVYSIG